MRGAGYANRQRRWIYDDGRLSRNAEFLSFGISDDPDDFAPLILLWRACGISYERYCDGRRQIVEPLEIFDRYEAIDNGIVPMLFDYFSGELVDDIIYR